MKKLLIVTIGLLVFANCSYAQFTMPNISFKKNIFSTKTVVEKDKNDVVNNDKNDDIQKPAKLKKSVSETKQEKATTKQTSSSDNEFQLNNIFKKQNNELGEDFVSREQIRGELEKVNNLSQQAIALYTDNNLDESLKTFMRIPEKYRSAQDYVLMGNLLMDLNRKEDAIFMYKRAILTDEYNYKAYYNIGNICLNDDKFYMAINYYKKAIKYAPDFAYSYYNLGCAYIKTDDLRKAKSMFIKAIELKNTEPDFHYNLAYVYKKLNKPKSANIYLKNYNKLTNGL